MGRRMGVGLATDDLDERSEYLLVSSTKRFVFESDFLESAVASCCTSITANTYFHQVDLPKGNLQHCSQGLLYLG
jgi:hypothetical protein